MVRQQPAFRGDDGPTSQDRSVPDAVTGAEGTLKRFRDGTHRAVDPDETLRRIAPYREAMGITRVANLTGLDRIGIPVVAVYRPNARSLAVSQGKGATMAAARASGLMEAVESYHAEHITRPTRQASYVKMRRSARTANVGRLPRPRRSTFRAQLPIPWIEGLDLLDGESVWVPYEMVHLDFRFPPPPGSGAFVMSSNGLASGNHYLEAIVHALCEAIERDATTLSLQDDLGTTVRLDLESVDDPTCRAVLDRYVASRVSVAVWDTTTDIGVASFLCQIAEPPEARMRPVSGAHGMGCHPDRKVALLRALTEAAQCRLTWISGARDDARAEDYDASPERFRFELDCMAVRGPMRHFHDVPTFEALTFEEDLEWILGRLRGADTKEVIWVDLTRPEFGIPVVRVIVPGLEPTGFGSAFGDYVPGPRARRRRRQ
jgi:YcaO-like protein with predicted kinase domain